LAFEIEIKRKALHFIESLDGKRKQKIGEIVIILKDDPVPFRREDVVKLKDSDSTYRIRIGELRMVYTVSWTERKVMIHYVGPRGDAYG
jgi:mRNA-degrading endonuclease RelE of RelBE toxin-antitoxin system